MFSIYLKELEKAPDKGCFQASGIKIFAEKIGRQPTEKNAILIKVDLTTEEAEEEGMVCGGILEVFLEKM